MEVLPVPGGPTRQRMGLVPFFVSDADCQVFQHPLLDLLQAIMILVQNLFRMLQASLLSFGHFVPGQFQQRFQI